MLPRRVSPLRACFAAAALSLAAQAQTAFAVGTRSVAWPNPTALGSTVLAATVHYPALTAGVDAPVLPRPGGWPVVVFLHGFGFLGNSYVALAERWASTGFVVVASDTCQWDWDCQEADGRAIYSAVLAATTDVADPFFGACDVARIGIAGHSMGGMSVGNVLATNPGYRCGMAIAPVTPFGPSPASITVPFGIVVGEADTITPWLSYSQPYYDAVTAHGSMKFLYLIDSAGDHLNVGGLSPLPWSTTTTEAFERSADVCRGFLQHCLRADPTGLEEAIGPAAITDPLMTSLQREIAVPQMWTDSRFHLGATTRMSIAIDGVFAGVFASPNAIAPLPTGIGDLEIDLNSAFLLAFGLANSEQRVDIVLAIPNDPLLITAQVALQSLGESPVGSIKLSNPIFLPIEP